MLCSGGGGLGAAGLLQSLAQAQGASSFSKGKPANASPPPCLPIAKAQLGPCSLPLGDGSSLPPSCREREDSILERAEQPPQSRLQWLERQIKLVGAHRGGCGPYHHQAWGPKAKETLLPVSSSVTSYMLFPLPGMLFPTLSNQSEVQPPGRDS